MYSGMVLDVDGVGNKRTQQLLLLVGLFFLSPLCTSCGVKVVRLFARKGVGRERPLLLCRFALLASRCPRAPSYPEGGTEAESRWFRMLGNAMSFSPASFFSPIRSFSP